MDSSISAVRGSVVVLKRELRALLSDKQAIYVTLVFGLLFPFLISRDPENTGGVVGLVLQVSLFPFVAAFQGAIVAFAGEREKGTIGPLLATPLPNAAIFGGKLLGTFVPGLATALVSLAVVLSTLPAKPRAELSAVPARFFFLAISISLVTGLVLSVSGTIIGSRAQTLRGAQLFAGVLIGPIVIGMIFLGGVLFEHETIGWFVLAGVVLACWPLTALGAKVWRREEILTKV